MKRVISIILAIILLFTLVGCGQTEDKGPATDTITEVEVTIPCSTGMRAIVEGEAVIATQTYLLARAYFEKLETYDMDSFDAQEYSKLLAEATEAFRIAGAFIDSLNMHAGALSEIENNDSIQQEKAKYELLSMSTGNTRYSPFVTVAYAAEEKSPAEKYAEELTRTFDNSKNGHKLMEIAEKYGADVKKAKETLEQAQAILAGAAYEDQAAFENKCCEAAVETKAAASVIEFDVAIVTTGGASISGLMEAGGLVMNGVNAVIDMSTAVTIHTTKGEGSNYTAAWENRADMVAPIGSVFVISGGIQNIKDFRDPEKAKDMVINAAQEFLAGIGFVRDYIQDGTVMGVSSKIIDGYRQIIVRSADTSNSEAAKDVLLKTGLSEETMNNDGSSAQQVQEGYPGTEADIYIEAMGETIDTEGPLDVNAFLENVDNAFRESAVEAGVENVEVNAKVKEENAEVNESKTESKDPVTEPESYSEIVDSNDTLSADDICGTYSLQGTSVWADDEGVYEEGVSLTLTVSRAGGTNMSCNIIDNEYGDSESFVGPYNEETQTASYYIDGSNGGYISFELKNGTVYASLQMHVEWGWAFESETVDISASGAKVG